MIRDITLGQYFPGNSVIHRMDPRMKIILTILFIVMLFVAGNWAGFAVTLVFVLAVVLISKIHIKFLLKSIKPILPLIIFTSVLNLFFVAGTPIFSYGIINITYEGIDIALRMSFRVIILIMGTSILTYTTSPISLTDGIERLMSPLKKIRFPVHEMAMMMTIALRFIPTLIEETDKIMSAQKARGADLESGGIIKRSKALVPVLVPLFISAFRRAEELALAMECRCYQGGEGRTRMKILKFSSVDFLALAVVAITFGVIIAFNILF